jgi:hypothetical protein
MQPGRDLETFHPSFRFALKAKIHGAGFRTISEFSNAIGFGAHRISRVVSGWELPSPAMQKAMADGLGLTIKQLKELL